MNRRLLLGCVSAMALVMVMMPARALAQVEFRPTPVYLPPMVPPVTSVNINAWGASVRVLTAAPTVASPIAAAVATPVTAVPATPRPVAAAPVANSLPSVTQVLAASGGPGNGGPGEPPATFLTLPLITQCLLSRQYRRDNPNCMGYVMQRYLTAFPPRLLVGSPTPVSGPQGVASMTTAQAAKLQKSADHILHLLQAANYNQALSEAQGLYATVKDANGVPLEVQHKVAKMMDLSEGLSQSSQGDRQGAVASFASAVARDGAMDDLAVVAIVQEAFVEIQRMHEMHGIQLLQQALPLAPGQQASIEMKIGETLISMNGPTDSEGVRWLQRAIDDSGSAEMRAVATRTMAEAVRSGDPGRARQLIASAYEMCQPDGACGPDTKASVKGLRDELGG